MNNARTDANHAEIRDGLRDLGYTVIDTSKYGRGFPDLLVVTHVKKRIVLFENKTVGGKLTPAEKHFHDQVEGAPLFVVYDLDEATAILSGIELRDAFSE